MHMLNCYVLQYPSIILIEVDDLKEGFQKVIDNELFGMIGSLPSVAYELQHNPISGLVISGRLAQAWHLGSGARNDEPQLVGILNKVLVQLDKSKLDEITNQWMTIKSYSEPNYKFVNKGFRYITSSVVCVFFIPLFSA